MKHLMQLAFIETHFFSLHEALDATRIHTNTFFSLHEALDTTRIHTNTF